MDNCYCIKFAAFGIVQGQKFDRVIWICEETKIRDFKVCEIDTCVAHVVHHLLDRSCQSFCRCLTDPIIRTQDIGASLRACFEPSYSAWLILRYSFTFRAACKILIDWERRKNTQASNDVRARQLVRF